MLFRLILILTALQLPLNLFGDTIRLEVLLDSADVYRKIDLIESHKFLDKGLKALTIHPNDSLQCTFYYSKMLSYYFQAEYSACAVYLKKLKDNPCFSSAAIFRYRYYYFGSILQKRKSNIDSAIVLLKQAKTALNGSLNQDQELQILSSIGSSYYTKKQYKKAITHLLQAEDLFIQNPQLNRTQ